MTSTPPSFEQLIRNAFELDQAGRLEEAALAYETVLRSAPQLTDCWYNLGVVLRRLQRFEAALAAYDQALARGVREPEEVRVNKAVVLTDYLHRHADAERELEAALQANPRYVPALLNLGNLNEDLGRRAAAKSFYERALAVEPSAHDALARLAGLERIDNRRHPLVNRLQLALRDPQATAANRASLGFALGKLLDDCGDYDAAFAAFAEANRASIASAPPGTPRYDAAAEARFYEQLIAVFRGRQTSASAEPRGAKPIFVCGMFRSGSTLAERVLAGHASVRSGGELSLLASIVASRLQPFPDAVANKSAAELATLADAYFAQIDQLFPGAQHVTDKRPDNFVYIGLIKLLMPQAKIVHTIRHPLDVCLSNYFLHLDQRFGYAHELTHLAQHYRNYRRLMAHWQSLYGQDIFQFDYDAFVREPRANAQRLLEFVGLDWDERCLEIDRPQGIVKTASVWQVREPLYQRSSGRWRHYERHLAPLRAALGEYASA